MQPLETTLPPPEPVTAEIVPPAPSPWRFGLKALLGLMAVCSVQFAVMNYLGSVLWGMVAGMAACFVVFSAIVLGGMALAGSRKQWIAHLDALVVRLMLAMVCCSLGRSWPAAAPRPGRSPAASTASARSRRTWG